MVHFFMKKAAKLLLCLTMVAQMIFLPGMIAPEAMPDANPGEYGQWVDPFIGTGGIPWVSAMTSPGATTAFGTVRLSPDTCFALGTYIFRTNTSGYYYPQTYIRGFSHTRLSGTGVEEGGQFRVTPAVGNTNPTRRRSQPLYYQHDQEVATAGYYAVNLPTISCLAEMTATTHVGLHRYTFNTAKDAHLFLDATSFLANASATDGEITVRENGDIEGQARVQTSFASRYGGLMTYFVARLDTPAKAYSTWEGKTRTPGGTHAAGDDVGVDINLGNVQGKPVELKVALSFVSVENARENLKAEAGDGVDFDAVRAATRTDWDTWLSRIQIETADADIKTIFYTALYHSMLMPTNFTDTNGEYLGFNETVGKAEGFTYRSDLSLWDTFRTTHPLYTLIAPDIQTDSLQSLLLMAKEGGVLPRWPSGGGYAGSMFGTPADMVIAESYRKGIALDTFDYETAYQYMKKTSDGPAPDGVPGRNGIEEYNTLGYVPDETVTKSVARTLEYAWADGSIALLAQALGYEEEAAHYLQKSKNYQNVFNPQTKYFQALSADGTWKTPFLPNWLTYYDDFLSTKAANAYCEGSARQWRWSVVQDPQGLIALFGGKEAFVSELETFMGDASQTMSAITPGAGYWQGNQHDIHAPYLFNEAGRADLTQKWVRWSLAERHSTATNGLDGNDDGGTLSAWYVFSAMGLYPVSGSERYWIGSPNLDAATLQLGGGNTLQIVVHNQASENIYVQSVKLDGVPLTEPFIRHADLVNAAVLEFTMGPAPAANGGF